ncbi:MAG: hypothetical protein JST20_03505 [Bacteroidetes bacterium]|nr:hypothetical protein [Bacteroidota bacterium]
MRNFLAIFVVVLAHSVAVAQVDSVSVIDTTVKDYDYYGSARVQLFDAPPKPTPNYDSSSVVEKIISQNDLQEYLNDKTFDYDLETPDQTSLWEMFKRWFWSMLEQFFGTQIGAKVGKALMYVLIVIAIAIVNIILFRSKLGGLFGGKKANANVCFTVFDENIHELNFPELIATAEARSDYRHAIRLHYLWLLKRLSDDEIIQLKINKTNRDYRNEIRLPEIHLGFSQASIIFEYVWYGNVKIDKDKYQSAVQLFSVAVTPAQSL